MTWGHATGFVGDSDHVALDLEGQLASARGLDNMFAAISLHHRDNVGRQRLGGHNVAGQNFDELCLAPGLQESLDRALGPSIKRFVGRGKHGERPLPFRVATRPAALTAATRVA